MKLIDNTSDRNQTKYQLNMLGHESIIMDNTIEDLRYVNYCKRNLPEWIPSED